MIRFRFTADPAESIAFSYSPLLEAVLSLHVVTEPKHLPLQHRWVRKARTLPAALRRELAAFSFAYSSFVPEFLMPSPATGYHTFEDELQALEHLDEETLALGFLRPLYDHRGERDPRLLEDERVREHVAGRVASIGGDVELAALMFECRAGSSPASPRSCPTTGRPPSRRSGRRSSRASPTRSSRPAAGSRPTASTST